MLISVFCEGGDRAGPGFLSSGDLSPYTPHFRPAQSRSSAKVRTLEESLPGSVFTVSGSPDSRIDWQLILVSVPPKDQTGSLVSAGL